MATEVRQPRRSRDHTERMLEAMGVDVQEEAGGDSWVVRVLAPPSALAPLDIDVPADFSSAAFFLALAALRDGPGLTVQSVGLNETRTGFLNVLGRMGADVRIESTRVRGGEALGDVTVTGGGGLRAAEVGEAEVPALLDEVPVLAVLAARAEGMTRITGAAELRVKESDRLAALAANLRAIGVDAQELSDGLEIEGTDRPLAGRVRCHDDHRIAMAFGILGATPGCDIDVDDPAAANVSFPGFWELLASTSGGTGRSFAEAGG